MPRTPPRHPNVPVAQGRPAGAPVGAPGFTLAEMLAVMAIVGIIATIMAPLFTPDRWRADSAVQELAMGLNAAQRLAVLSQHDLVVTFGTADNVMRLHSDKDNDGVVDAGEDFRIQQLPENMGFGGSGAPALPRSGSPVNFASGGQDTILTFHRNGSASRSGILYLQPLRGSMASDPGAVRALSVERATGEVRCYSYRTGAWEPSC